jgi:hypothetical protein
MKKRSIWIVVAVALPFVLLAAGSAMAYTAGSQVRITSARFAPSHLRSGYRAIIVKWDRREGEPVYYQVTVRYEDGSEFPQAGIPITTVELKRGWLETGRYSIAGDPDRGSVEALNIAVVADPGVNVDGRDLLVGP